MKPQMIKHKSRFLSIFLLLIVNGLSPLLAEETVNIYVYAEPDSLKSKMLIDRLNDKFKQSVTVYNLNDQNNYGKFLEIVQTLIISIEEQASPQEGCKICLLSRYAKSYSPPIAGFFYNGELSAITVGVIQPETVDRLLNELKANAERGILIIKCNQTFIINDEKAKSKLERFFIKDDGGDLPPLIMLTSLALSDSLNPCTFAVFTALLLISLNAFGRKRTMITGTCFILAVFSGYYALGLGLIQFFACLPNIDKIASALGIFIGALNIIRGVKPEFKSLVPRALQGFINSRIDKSSLGPAASFLTDFLISLTLLPCTGGPYIVGITILSPLDAIQRCAYLALYNTIFVAPLIIILLVSLASTKYSRRIKIFRSKKLRSMEFASGVILTFICLYIILSSL